MITITHIPTNRGKSYANPRDAYVAWIAMKKNKNVNMDDIRVDCHGGPDVSAYNPDIPDRIVTLIEVLESTYGVHVPRWRWVNKPRNYYGRHGSTNYKMVNGAVITTHIIINSTGNTNHDFGTVLHEYAHAMNQYDERHGRRFYRTVFSLYRKYLTREEEDREVRDEWNYIKSSKYWYKELYNLLPPPPVYMALAKPTPQQKTENALDAIFGKEE